MLLIVKIIAKVANFFLKNLRIGAGYTWPGHVALALYPTLPKKLKKQFKKGLVFVSGTNGKTTTTKLISHILEKNSFRVCHNKSGANLLNGIVTEILLGAPFFGDCAYDVGVFEIDEFVLARTLAYLSPSVLVLLNLSRDQLDRYGETDTILEKWKCSITSLPKPPVLVLNACQEEFKELADKIGGQVLWFDGSQFGLLGSRGSFNRLNIHAALQVCSLFGISKEEALSSLGDFNAAYGRGELLYLSDKSFEILLAKNPASFNNNLDFLYSRKDLCDTLLFVLNDNIPDGRDVSWIYDIDPVKLAAVCTNKKVFVSGRRAYDMSVRLRYASVNPDSVRLVLSLKDAVGEILGEVSCKHIVALPNYSAMLDLRKVLIGKKIL